MALGTLLRTIQKGSYIPTSSILCAMMAKVIPACNEAGKSIMEATVMFKGLEQLP